MSALPFPAAIRDALTDGPRTNRSVLFDRCFASYDEHWQIVEEDRKHHVPEGKFQFLTAFRNAFARADTRGFEAALKRRRATLSAVRVCMRSTSRLVVGLGLPHPTETSLLLDRLTGCPHLPGSSVKGMLRGAAKLVVRGELAVADDPKDFWSEAAVRRLFGPAVGEPGYPAEGEMVFYDAFPAAWPDLELDVLTPHYSEYYGDRTGTVVPGDWENPTPVRFLTVQAGATFEFCFRGLCPDATQREQDEEAIKALLRLALDWLGIGGKKSSGYGVFEPAGTPRCTPAGAARAVRPVEVAPESQQNPERPAKAHDPRRHPEHAQRQRSPEDQAPFTPVPREAVRDVVSKEIVTLASLPEGKKAWVTTADGTRIRCKGVESYPQPKVGDRLKATVTRKDGVAVDAQFKGWM